jgi:hypothetical protein
VGKKKAPPKKKGGTGLALVFCVVAAYLAFHDASPSPQAGKVCQCQCLENLWESAGGSSSEAFMAAEIAMAESSGDQYDTNKNTNGTVDRGYWQINSVHGALSTFDAYANARSAVIISQDGTNWYPWTTYNQNKYEGQCLSVIM